MEFIDKPTFGHTKFKLSVVLVPVGKQGSVPFFLAVSERSLINFSVLRNAFAEPVRHLVLNGTPIMASVL